MSNPRSDPFEALAKNLQRDLDEYYLATGRPAYGDLAIRVDNMSRKVKILDLIVANSDLTKEEWTALVDLVAEIIRGQPDEAYVQTMQPLLAKLKLKAAGDDRP